MPVPEKKQPEKKGGGWLVARAPKNNSKKWVGLLLTLGTRADLRHVHCRAYFFGTKEKSIQDHIMHAFFYYCFHRNDFDIFNDLFPVVSW